MIGRSSAQADLPARLTALRAALELSERRLTEDVVAFGRQVDVKATARLRHGTTHTLVALLGATGSGKSSVANALAGSEIATTGVRRPTTSSTLACVFGPDDAQGLLDWLEVQNRHLIAEKPDLTGLVLLDVPDHDSVAVSHRLEMERIAEHADLLVWVTDPEKYADKAMHGYLRDLSHHGAVMIMVLNKTDGLSQRDVAVMEQDLARLLTVDGLNGPAIVTTSAVTGVGIDGLRQRLTTAVEQQRMMVERLSADVTVAAEALAEQAGRPADIKDRRIDKVSKKLAADLVGASGVDVVAQAVAAGHRRDASAQTGWPFTRWLRRFRPHPLRKLHLGSGSAGRTSRPGPSGAQTARTQAAIRDAADAVAEDLPGPWPTLVREAATPDQRVLHDQLDVAVADAVRSQEVRSPRWWTVVGSLQLVLAIATVVGALWLLALAGVAYLQFPDFPTPSYRGVPVPTGLLLFGALLGWLLAVLSRQLAGVGAKRRASQTRKLARDKVETVAEELVMEPLRRELARRDELVASLAVAVGG